MKSRPSSGFLTILYDKDRGFVLNGESVKMKGVNLHQDGGSVGAAVPIGVWERRFKTLKKIGCNAIRCSHNPPAPEFLGVGNENGGAWPEKNFAIYRKLPDVVHQVEPTRPVTAALRPFEPPKENPTKEGLLAQMLPRVNAMDVACFNYQEHLYEELRRGE